MKVAKFYIILTFYLASCISVYSAYNDDCALTIKSLFLQERSSPVTESEWKKWNTKSDAEIARHRENKAGTWGQARLKSGIHPLHTHKQGEWYFITKGIGKMQIGHKIIIVKAGDQVYIPGNVQHAISKDLSSKEDLIFEYFFPDVSDYDNTVEYIWL